MAGTVTFTYDDGVEGQGLRNQIRKVTASWTSDASGNASGASRKVVGALVKAVTVPGTSGSQPTNNYTVTVTETINGNNALGNAETTLAGNQSNSAAQETYFYAKNLAGTAQG